MSDHLDFARLNDLADHRLSAREAAMARAHLAACEWCRELHESLGRTIGAAAALPRDVMPPVGTWDDVRLRLAPRRRVVSISFPALAAAALLIVALSSGVTALVLRGDAAPTPVPARVTASAALPVPVSFAATERDYAESAARLEVMLASRRDSLAPATVTVVERSLRLADSAIAEARAALAHDPANRAIEAILVSNYDRKIDLLRRATELAPRT